MYLLRLFIFSFFIIGSSYSQDKVAISDSGLDVGEQFAKEFIDHQNCQYELKPEELREIYKISCETLKIAEKLALGENVVPPVIYHYGQKKYMVANAKEGNIPKKVWKKFIMSSKTRFRYESNLRNGFYGTANPLNNSFGDPYGFDWVNEIHIASSCRDEKHVASLMNLYAQKKFINWLDSKSKKEKRSNKYFQSVKEFKDSCFRSDFSGRVRIRMDYSGRFSGEKKKQCKNTIEDFVSEADIKIIQDHIIAGSWYIKDRSCILNIRGTEEDIVQMILDRPELLYLGCPNEDKNEQFYRIVQKAITNEFSKGRMSDERVEELKSLIDSVPLHENKKSLISSSLD